MRDILPQLARWHAEGKRMALATVVETWGSAPRRMGARMAVTQGGEIAGSVSGGCVENAVVEAALRTLKTGQAQLLHFDVPDTSAWRLGLACGGTIDVFEQPLDGNLLECLRAAWMDSRATTAATVIRGPREQLGNVMLIRNRSILNGALDAAWKHAVLALASGTAAEGTAQRLSVSESTEVFLELITPPPALIAVGGVHVAVALTSIAKTLGYRTVVIDPRRAWESAERFPNVDELVRSWPDEAFHLIPVTHSSAIVTLTHDPKLDDPALKIALESPAFYVGALGSKSTQRRRRERLLANGLTEAQLARLHAPIGLDIGAESPEEIALAIMAQIVETYRKRPSIQVAAPGSV